MASSDDRYFPSFSAFIDSVHGARHDDYAVKPAARAEKSDAFDAMRAHILDLYEGVDVAHSFVDLNGQVFDCIPIEAQPSLRGSAEGPAGTGEGTAWRSSRARWGEGRGSWRARTSARRPRVST